MIVELYCNVDGKKTPEKRKEGRNKIDEWKFLNGVKEDRKEEGRREVRRNERNISSVQYSCKLYLFIPRVVLHSHC